MEWWLLFFGLPSCWPIPSTECALLRYSRCSLLVFLLLLSGSLIFSHLPLHFRGPQPLYSVLISCHTAHSAISELTTVHGLNPKLKLKSYVMNKEKEMATHSGILVREIPFTEAPGGLWSMGSQRVRHDWSDLAPTQPHFSMLVCFLSVPVLLSIYSTYIWSDYNHTFHPILPSLFLEFCLVSERLYY